ncbi:MAG: exodeoxyribonuclease VII small subunit [Methanobrevibacter sp.]|uniref:exodeoxyribonuclease VII small subunit n=1 Tax=Methanobrevibacter sp. TaxID=66852 RepID=UPI0025FE1E5E|nr:exodeoxyribonuclease VII small subunit [Methanobrevibacter sp.]MBE6507909.1 exodeoxyribonuclease VII small subunit [Methanobrevibacter sp.]
MSEKTFEENMVELQGIVEKLENGDVNLDEAIAEFEKAMVLIQSCDAKLKEAEDTIAKIVDENKDVVEFNQD